MAPLIGQSFGFGATGSVRRDLALRAASCGIEQGALFQAIATTLQKLSEIEKRSAPIQAVDGDARLSSPATLTLALSTGRAKACSLESILDLPFAKLDAKQRAVFNFAAAYAVPASLYVADGALLPQDRDLAAALLPWLKRRRREAAIVWLTASVTHLRRISPDAVLLLRQGRLTCLAGIEEAIAIFEQPGRGKRPSAASSSRRPPTSRPRLVRSATGHGAKKLRSIWTGSSAKGDIKPEMLAEPKARQATWPAIHSAATAPPPAELGPHHRPLRDDDRSRATSKSLSASIDDTPAKSKSDKERVAPKKHLFRLMRVGALRRID
ncbi:MAG: hypothetical protein AAF677_02050 [Pseudomonadota bacterium]